MTTIPSSRIQDVCTAILNENKGAARGKLLKLAFDRLESFNAHLTDADKDSVRAVVQRSLDKAFRLGKDEEVLQSKEWLKISAGSGKLEQGRRLTTISTAVVSVAKQLEIVYAEYARHIRKANDSVDYLNSKSFATQDAKLTNAVYCRINYLAMEESEAERLIAKQYLNLMSKHNTGDKRNEVKFLESATQSVITPEPETEKQPEAQSENKVESKELQTA